MTFAAGQILTADALNALFTDTLIKKAAAETRTSTTTAKDDNDIVFALAVGTYAIEMVLHATGAEAGDVKVGWTNTGTMTISRAALGGEAAMTDRLATPVTVRGMADGSTHTYGIDGTGTTWIRETFVVTVTVAGTLQMQWAQGTSSATASTLTSSSWALARKIVS